MGAVTVGGAGAPTSQPRAQTLSFTFCLGRKTAPAPVIHIIHRREDMFRGASATFQRPCPLPTPTPGMKLLRCFPSLKRRSGMLLTLRSQSPENKYRNNLMLACKISFYHITHKFQTHTHTHTRSPFLTVLIRSSHPLHRLQKCLPFCTGAWILFYQGIIFTVKLLLQDIAFYTVFTHL